MEHFARQDVLAALARFGIGGASRATTTDDTEEVILLAPEDYAAVDPSLVTRALMDVLPHMKVWVIEDSPGWVTEPI